VVCVRSLTGWSERINTPLPNFLCDMILMSEYIIMLRADPTHALGVDSYPDV
jgi:hypothetical protein